MLLCALQCDSREKSQRLSEITEIVLWSFFKPSVGNRLCNRNLSLTIAGAQISCHMREPETRRAEQAVGESAA